MFAAEGMRPPPAARSSEASRARGARVASSRELRSNVHIDGGETSVGDGAADGTGKGEARVQGEAGLLLGGGSAGLLDDSVDLGRTGVDARHDDGVCEEQRQETRAERVSWWKANNGQRRLIEGWEMEERKNVSGQAPDR